MGIQQLLVEALLSTFEIIEIVKGKNLKDIENLVDNNFNKIEDSLNYKNSNYNKTKNTNPKDIKSILNEKRISFKDKIKEYQEKCFGFNIGEYSKQNTQSTQPIVEDNY